MRLRGWLFNTSEQESVAFSYSSASGYNAYDYEKIAIEYINSNSDLQDKYGEGFEFKFISSVGDVSFAFSRYIVRGTAQYVVEINDDQWVVDFSKSYFGKWKINGLHLRNEDNQ